VPFLPSGNAQVAENTAQERECERLLLSAAKGAQVAAPLASTPHRD
jgi:hypothetical protein